MDCRVCGRQFDPQGFQVMVPGLPYGFDRVDCALEAHALGLPPERVVEPAPAVMRALPTPLAAVPALAGVPGGSVRVESARPQFWAGANLALLAAGTAATIYLWLRVFGADAGPVSFPAANASDAFARSTVAAAIDLSPAPEARPQPESAVRGGGSQPATSPPVAAVVSGGGATLVTNRTPAKPRPSNRPGGGPVVRPTNPPPAPAPTPPAEPGPSRSAPVPTFPVPSTPPADRVPGPTLPGGTSPGQPALPGGTRD
jgi:hypothetical protein